MTKTTKTNELHQGRLINSFKVHMVANDHGESIRMVSIPQPSVRFIDELEEGTKLRQARTLEMVFYYGQNDMIPVEGTCSVSMGDVIELDGGKFFVVQSMGFQEMTTEELEEYKTIDENDRTWSKFVRPEYAARMATKETN